VEPGPLLLGPLLYQSQMKTYDNEYVGIGGALGRGTRSTQRKSVPVPLCLPQIPHDLPRARTRTAAVGRRWLAV
jgi:hypothetical protein